MRLSIVLVLTSRVRGLVLDVGESFVLTCLCGCRCRYTYLLDGSLGTPLRVVEGCFLTSSQKNK